MADPERDSARATAIPERTEIHPMAERCPVDATEAFERLLAEEKRERYVLRLYVTGMTERSMKSIEGLKAICEQVLPGRYDLEVVNLYDNPEMAEKMQIIAAPTLVKELPLPARWLVGDVTDRGRVILVLQ